MKQCNGVLISGLISMGLLLPSLWGCVLNPQQSAPVNGSVPGQTGLRKAQKIQALSMHPEAVTLEIKPQLLGADYAHLPARPILQRPHQGFTIQSQPSQSQPLTPQVNCVKHHSSGGYTAYFGYQNDNPQAVSLPIGPTNQLVGPNNDPQWSDPRDRGQPTTFQPGNTPAYPDSAFSVNFSNGSLVWHLDGRSVRVNKHTQPHCPTGSDPSPGPSSDPSPAPTPSPEPSPEPSPTPPPDEIIFDPADPASLGDLFPDVPGNQNQPEPETFSSYIMLNDHLPEPVTTGHVLVQLAEPVEANLQALLTEYNARLVMEPINGMYAIQPDMTYVFVEDLADNLRLLNSLATDPEHVITYGAFGNLESAKTLAFATSLALDHRVSSVGFDPVLELASAVNTQEQQNPSMVLGDNVTPIIPSAQNSWWLNERSTWITHAWRYSLGFSLAQNRPIKVAVIDSGFAGLSYHDQPGKDLHGQILWQDGAILNELNNGIYSLLSWTQDRRQAEESLIEPNVHGADAARHGTHSVGTIVSRFNNGTGIAGVAPYAKVIPIKLGKNHVNADGSQSVNIPMSNLHAAIQYAGLKNADIVNISMNRNATDPFLYNYFDTYINQESWIKPAQVQIQSLSAAPKRMVFINSAGNQNWDAENALPGSKLFPEIITVGALADAPELSTPSLNSNASNLTRMWRGGDTKKLRQMGSNFGNYVSIWAPGSKLLSLTPPYNYTVNGLFHPTELSEWSQTSASAPVVSGIAALLKAIDPNLTGTQIKSILQNTARHHTYVDDFLRTNPVFFGPEVPGSECIVMGKPISCGDIYSNTLNLKTANALKAVQNLNPPQSQIYRGVLEPIDGVNGYGLNLSNASQGFNYALRAGDNANLGEYLAEYETESGQIAYIKVKELRAQFFPGAAVADVEGWPVPGTEYMQVLKIRWLPYENQAPEPTPTPQPTSSPVLELDLNDNEAKWWVRAFNGNDRLNVIVNNQLYAVSNLSFDGIREIEITDALHPFPLANEVRFQVFNDSNSGNSQGSSWGFELVCDCPSGPAINTAGGDKQIYYHDIQGIAAGPNQHPARFGDPTLGLVYDQKIVIYKNGVIPSSGTYRLHTFNASDKQKLTLFYRDETGATITHNVVEQNGAEPYSKNIDLDPLLIHGAKPNLFELFVDNGFDTNAAYTYGFEIYRTVPPSMPELILRHRSGNKEMLGVHSSGGHLHNLHNTGAQGIHILSDINLYDRQPILQQLSDSQYNPGILKIKNVDMIKHKLSLYFWP